ncbi:MAG: pyrimidine/purine nucleoside phosphorylase [Puniceicoccaceae bacterium]|nr:pyrimidine/purine nucleoside phosphorylase [Puniceicoccaceae bacterium]
MPETFENVSIIKKANVYFGGQVTSRTVQFADGSKKTLGFMQAGDYDFGTEAAELMEILGGAMDVKLAGSDAWNTYAEGQAFEVEGNSKFSLKVADGGADYCCSYIQ